MVVYLLLLLLLLLQLDSFSTPQLISSTFPSHLSISIHHAWYIDIPFPCLKFLKTPMALAIRLRTTNQVYKSPPSSQPYLALHPPCSICSHHPHLLYSPRACQSPILPTHRPFHLHINSLVKEFITWLNLSLQCIKFTS